MAQYQVIKTNQVHVDLAENQPFRRVDICAINWSWEGEANNRAEAVSKATQVWQQQQAEI